MRFASRILFLFVVVSIATGGVDALPGQEAFQASDRDIGLLLVPGRDGWVVHRPDGERRPVALPGGFMPYRFEATAEGWVAAGWVALGARTELRIVAGGVDGLEVLPAPPDRFGLQRGNPVPFVEDGFLRGLAWVEGDRQEDLVVIAAEWLGSRWGTVEVVSPRGPGAQMALSGTVLANGEWLALWSAFDGEDDEIFWSRRGRAGWTSPERLHPDNAVPDITPTVIATESGALAAWSVYDGSDYRLRLARLQGGAWVVDGFTGERGSLFPQALRGDGRLMVLYSTVIPEGWALVELDQDGAVRRRLRAAEPTERRPVVLSDPGGDPLFAWPDGSGAPRRVIPEVVPRAEER